MRSITASQRTLLEDRERKVYLRAVAGTTDLSPWLASARWSESVDGGAGKCAVTLLSRNSSGAYVAPVIAGTVALGQRLKLSVALKATPADPVAADWIEVFDATVTSVNWSGERVVVQGVQYLAHTLSQLWVEDETSYGSDAGRQLHLVMRDVLSGWGGGVTLAVAGGDSAAPSFTVTTYAQRQEPVLRALLQLAGLAGWDVRPLWSASASAFALTLLQPGRSDTTPDWTLDADDYLRLTRVITDLDRVKNVVEVAWVDTSGVGHTTEVTRAASVTAVGRRWTRFEAETQIDTTAEAQSRANAALDDLATPSVDATIETPLLWHLELGDLLRIPASARHWTAAQTLAVQGIQHEWGGSEDKSVIRLSGKPSYGRAKWLAQSIAHVQQEPSLGYGEVRRGVESGARFVEVTGLRARGGDLYWRTGTGELRAPVVQTGMGGSAPAITFAKDDGWGLKFFGDPLPPDVTIAVAKLSAFPLVSETIPVGSIPTPMNAPVLTITTSGETTINASWTAVAGATGYQYRSSTTGAWSSTTGTTASFTGLNAGTEYAIQVRATSTDSNFASPSPIAQQTATTGQDATILYGVGTGGRVLRMDSRGNATLFATLPLITGEACTSLCRVGTGVLFILANYSAETLEALWASDLTATAIAGATKRTSISRSDRSFSEASVIYTGSNAGYILFGDGDLHSYGVSSTGTFSLASRIGRVGRSWDGLARASDGTVYALDNTSVSTVNVSNATRASLGAFPSGASGGTGIAASDDNLYLLTNNRLWRSSRTAPSSGVNRGTINIGGNNETGTQALDIL